MSEYQYYEFQAIDRPLSADERDQLRIISTRARITATSFVNSYDFGGLKADPLDLLERYFDLFVYVANWGTREFAMRFPKNVLDLSALERFHLDDDVVQIRPSREHVIVSVGREETDMDDFDDGSGHLASLAPLRTDIIGGDLRLFSLLWLLQVQYDWIRDEAVEPPPGLTRLSGPLSALAEFLGVASDLLEAATATGTPAAPNEPSAAEIEAFLRALPEDDKVALLLHLHAGDEPHLGAQLRRRCQEACGQRGAPAGAQRTAGELRDAAHRIEEQRKRAAEERSAAERRRRDEEAANARTQHLAALASRGAAVWHEVEDLIAMRSGSGYDKAVALLVDLRNLATDGAAMEQFADRVNVLRTAHDRKRQFIERLKTAGL